MITVWLNRNNEPWNPNGRYASTASTKVTCNAFGYQCVKFRQLHVMWSERPEQNLCKVFEQIGKDSEVAEGQRYRKDSANLKSAKQEVLSALLCVCG